MASKKNYYYVMVCTNEGPKFVTGTEGNWANWDIDKPPKELGRKYAKEIARGLCWNLYTAYVVVSEWDLTVHPYNYNDYEFSFKAKGE